MVDVRKRLVRDLQAAHPGMKPTAAVRLLDQAAALRADPPQAWGRLISGQGYAPGRSWRAEYRPVAGQWTPGTFAVRWVPENAPRFAAQLRDDLDTEGWTLPDAWPLVPDDAALFPLWRSARGIREDDAAAIHAAAGKNYHDLPELYAAAVADALDRAGISVTDWWANPDDPRNLGIQLTYPPARYEEMHIVWHAVEGWVYLPSSTIGQHGGDFTGDLGCDYLALPGDVAAAVLTVVDPDKPAGEPCPWTPPAGYTTTPELPADDVDYSPELERALAAYATHPAVQS